MGPTNPIISSQSFSSNAKNQKGIDIMRLPNGYGNVSKLPGNRRKPYRARITAGWEYDESGTPQQKYKTIGYYETREAGLDALAQYHRNPYDIDTETITFAGVYEKWSAEHYPKIVRTNASAYELVYSYCTSLYNMPFRLIRRSHLQGIIDHCGKNYPIMCKIKVLYSQLYKYAMQNDICDKNYAQFVDISQYKDRNPKAIQRSCFSQEEIDKLWGLSNEDRYCTIVLMLIYSGVRIGELLDLKKENVNITEKWFYVAASKTKSGIRRVPIAEKILPYFIYWYNECDCDYLIGSISGKHLTYANFLDYYWNQIMERCEMTHRPHDTRHTCISMLATAGIDDKIIKKIVGHKGQSVTEVVYTHFDFDELLKAINKI